MLHATRDPKDVDSFPLIMSNLLWVLKSSVSQATLLILAFYLLCSFHIKLLPKKYDRFLLKMNLLGSD